MHPFQNTSFGWLLLQTERITVSGDGLYSWYGYIWINKITSTAEPGYADGKTIANRFNAPAGIAFDRNGNLFIVDASNSNNSYIRKLSSDGMVTTFYKHEWNPKTSQYEEVE